MTNMDLYVCKNSTCRVHTFHAEKGWYSVECPVCHSDDIKNGNRVNAKQKESQAHNTTQR